MAPMRVAPGTIAVWSDLGCPWSHAVVLAAPRCARRLGLEAGSPSTTMPSRSSSSTASRRRFRCARRRARRRALAPRAGWQPWSAPAHAWPVTMLPPMEAVLAAKLQSPAASEELDRGLRRAFWGESRCISLRHVILEVANECDSVDVGRPGRGIDDGRARARAARRLGDRPRRRGARLGAPLRAGRHATRRTPAS